MKTTELSGLSVDESNERLNDTRKSLYNLRVQATFKELKNVAQIRNEKRNIARLKQAIANKEREQAQAK